MLTNSDFSFAVSRILVEFLQTGFDRRQNDGTNESLLYKPIIAFRALSTTRHAPDDVLRDGDALSESVLSAECRKNETLELRSMSVLDT